MIEFSNELVEKAAVMSDESSSDDEDWRAKQEDITEQLHQVSSLRSWTVYHQHFKL